MFRKIGWTSIVLGLLSILGEVLKLQLPTVRWPFNTSREFGFLHSKINVNDTEVIIPWFGYVLALSAIILGVIFLVSFKKDAVVSPITQRRIKRFKEIRRGYISLIIILLLAVVASLDHMVVGNKALIVKTAKGYAFPAFVEKTYLGQDFGITGTASKTPVDYRELDDAFEKDDQAWVLMPLIPYEPTQDTVKVPVVQLEERSGVLYRNAGVKPYNGLAATLYDTNEASKFHLRYRFRKGLKDGLAEGKDSNGKNVYKASFAKGELVSETWSGEGDKDTFLNAIKGAPYEVLYFPARPASSTGHLLGTNSSGYDLVAYLYGGLQVNFKAALFYIPAVYLIGISVGLMMGFFGGKFDLLVQRLIEIFSNIPFLFIVIIISSSVPEDYKGLGIILVILVLFGWMGMTYLMRTAAYKEKARDYVAASKVLGASTPRIIFKHILPNTMAILVTLVPFSVSGLIMSLTSLDYLGFGLPPKYATWGTLMRDGLDNLSSPWLVGSAFVCLVALLILVTFIGEAVREAFDPKKYTFYK